MMNRQATTQDPRRRGLSLIETVLSLLILGGAFVALLETVSSARKAQAIASERQFATLLAEDMMSEVLGMPNYKEGSTLGPDSGEAIGNRSAFDDVDDYHNWTATPPVDRDGVVIPGSNGYTRTVVIARRQLNNTNVNSVTDQGVLLIKITILRNGKEVLTFRGLRTDAWQPAEENY